jgi:hypothetical protein
MFRENGKLLSHSELMQRYSIKCHVLKYLSLVRAIPKKWLKELQKISTPKFEKVSLNVHDSNMKLTSKKVYWKLLGKTVKQATAIEQWISLFPFLHDNDLDDIFIIPKTVTETRLQSFQYKLLHRIFPCNYKLFKWSIVESPKCNNCDLVDTQEHYFFYCNESRSFWNSVETWLRELYNVHIPLKITDVMFGIPHRKTQDNMLYILNFVTVYGKWYIYTRKKECKRLIFARFKKYLKYTLSVEYQVAINKNKQSEFKNRWSFIVSNL